MLPLSTKDLTQHYLWSYCFTLTVPVESHIPIISLFTTMSPVFTLENSTFSGTDTYLLRTNFVAATWRHCEYVSDVRFFACTVNLLLRSLTHSSLLSTLPQTPFRITLQILVENSLSFVSGTAPEHAKGELCATGELSFTACSSASDSTDNDEALLLKSLPSCKYNNRQHYTLHQQSSKCNVCNLNQFFQYPVHTKIEMSSRTGGTPI